MDRKSEAIYEEAVRLRRSFDEDVREIRNRAGMLLAALLVSVTFLGSQAADSSGRLSILAAMAIVVFFVAGSFAAWVLFPTRLTVAVSPRKLQESAQEYEEADFYCAIARRHEEHYDKNVKNLNKLYLRFKVASVAFLIGMLLLVTEILTEAL